MPKKQVIGVVTSDKCAKTRRVEIDRLVRHAKYGKIINVAAEELTKIAASMELRCSGVDSWLTYT